MCRSRDPRPKTGPDDFSVTHGREAIVSPTNVYSTGRGGAGNLHYPSCDGSRVCPTPNAAEQEVIREYVAVHDNVPSQHVREVVVAYMYVVRNTDNPFIPCTFCFGVDGVCHLRRMHPSDLLPSCFILPSFPSPPSRFHSALLSRSRSRDPNSDAHAATSTVKHTTIHISHAVDSTGRGGAGNIYPSDGVRADVIDEEARRVSQERERDAL